jgi:hypothetical protein
MPFLLLTTGSLVKKMDLHVPSKSTEVVGWAQTEPHPPLQSCMLLEVMSEITVCIGSDDLSAACPSWVQ